jgi:hypothetical protein
MNGRRLLFKGIICNKYFSLLIIVYLFNISLFAQEKRKKEPEIHIDVTTETNENGNIIRYDSTYTWSYSNMDTLWGDNKFFRDSVFQIFRHRFDTSVFNFPFSFHFPDFPDFNFDYSSHLDSSFWKHFDEKFFHYDPLYNFDFDFEPFFPFDTLLWNNGPGSFFQNEPFPDFDEFFKNYHKNMEQYFDLFLPYPDFLPPLKKPKHVPKKIFFSNKRKV